MSKRLGITGSSGFVGHALVHAAKQAGWLVYPFVRRAIASGEAAISWDPARGLLDPRDLESLDAVIHLGGASLFSPWTPKQRETILRSRIDSTRLLAVQIAKAARGPMSLVSLSAVGYYGETGEERVTEAHAPGTGFLSRVCVEWEHAADVAAEAGIRVVHPRLGIVLDPGGGALKKLVPFVRCGLGAVLGDGQQWMSWIALQDCVHAMLALLEDQEVAGPMNWCAPQALRNCEFVDEIATSCHRPRWLRVPGGLLTTVLGDFARELLLSSCFMKQHPWLEGRTPTTLTQVLEEGKASPA